MAAGILSMAVAGATFLYGQLGLMSFGQGVFFGLGAYAAGMAAIHLNSSIDLALLFATVTGALSSLAIGALIVSRKGVYFALLTVAFGQFFAFLNHSLHSITGGENGLMGIDRGTTLFGTGLSIGSTQGFFVFAYFVFLLAMALLFWVWDSQFGRSLPAIRDNELRAQSLGYDVFRRKLLAFIIAGSVTGLAGGMYAMSAKFVAPSTIEYEMSERIILMTILGGRGSLHGAWLGTGFMVIASDLLGQYWSHYLIIVGIALIMVVLFMPAGLFGLWTAAFRKARACIFKDRLIAPGMQK